MGARIYNTLINFIKGEYRKRGYSEVVTPNVFNVDLWKTSGHYANYKYCAASAAAAASIARCVADVGADHWLYGGVMCGVRCAEIICFCLRLRSRNSL